MKQGVLQDESMEIHVASMSNGGEHKNMKKTAAKLKKTVEKRDNHAVVEKKIVEKRDNLCKVVQPMIFPFFFISLSMLQWFLYLVFISLSSHWVGHGSTCNFFFFLGCSL